MDKICVEVRAILWKYSPLINGLFSIKIRIARFKDVKYIIVGCSSTLEDWDEVLGLPQTTHPQFLTVAARIKELIEEVEFHRKLAEHKKEYHLTMRELKRRVEKKSVLAHASRPKKILELFDSIILNLEKDKKQGYADVFSHCKATVIKALNGKDKHFVDFSKQDAECYERQLSGLKANSISNYLRTFYRVWNIAIQENYCSKDFHPRQYIKFKAYKKYETPKRAVSREQVVEMESREYDEGSRILKNQLYWYFMYYCRGMEFVDMVHLKWQKNITDNYIRYVRSKTGRDIEFKLHPKAIAILKYFKSCQEQSDCGYVFPILYARHNTSKKVKSRIHDVLRKLNLDMNQIAKDTDGQLKVTSKVAKHSILSHLDKAGVPHSKLKHISAHETEEQLQTYLDKISENELAEIIETLIR